MHRVDYFSLNGRYGHKKVFEFCNTAHKRNCEYHTGIPNLKFFDEVHKNYEEAENFIRKKITAGMITLPRSTKIMVKPIGFVKLNITHK